MSRILAFRKNLHTASAFVLLLFLSMLTMSSLNAAPTVAWAATVTGGLVNPSAFPSGKRMMAVDVVGNVYVTGTQNNGVNQDFLTIKYDAMGATLWRAVANGETDKDDIAAALVLGDVKGASLTAPATPSSCRSPRSALTRPRRRAAGPRHWMSSRGPAAPS